MKTILAIVGVVAILFVWALFAVCNDDENDPNSFGPIRLTTATVTPWGSGIASTKAPAAGSGKVELARTAMAPSMSTAVSGRHTVMPGSSLTATRENSASAITATIGFALDPTISFSELWVTTTETLSSKAAWCQSTIRRDDGNTVRIGVGVDTLGLSFCDTGRTANGVVSPARWSDNVSTGPRNHDYDEGECWGEEDCGGQGYDYDYGSHDRNRNRDRNRGMLSPGPFRDSPVTICLPYSCNSGGEQSGGNRNDRRDEPPPDEGGRA